jgi:hypothetical protein
LKDAYPVGERDYKDLEFIYEQTVLLSKGIISKDLFGHLENNENISHSISLIIEDILKYLNENDKGNEYRYLKQ